MPSRVYIVQCVMPDGQKSCEYCQKNSLECVVTEDERRRYEYFYFARKRHGY
jgi:hypothetical protein